MIYWEDLKALTPRWALMNENPRLDISESDLSIHLYNGAKIFVMGMDEPARIEGPPLDGIILDEYGNMKSEVWSNHVRPALSTIGRPGWAWLIGVPEGRNHYWHLSRLARADRTGTWSYHHWTSESLLDPEEIAQAKIDLDELTYRQEYLGEFVVYAGMAFYDFDPDIHAEYSLDYQPGSPLIIALDFNVSPGVAAIMQEFPPDYIPGQPEFTGVIGEVWIPRHSNTPRVCKKIVADWGSVHDGLVQVYGDPAGGQRRTSAVAGNDWELVQQELGKAWEDIDIILESRDPGIRPRINAMNSRIKSASGDVRFRVDPDKAPQSCLDFEGTRILEGSAGEIDKKSDRDRTHITDAICYFAAKEYPVDGGGTTEVDTY
jgi:hypothetical protein